MALGTTNISTSLIRTTLSESNYNVFLLATSTLINKWSRYKPIRDAGTGANWPAGSNSKYGLNLPTDWGYLQPRGGSPGGSPDEPGRLGDFRGYEHDKANTDPPVYADYKTTEMGGGNVKPTTSVYNSIAWQGQWRFGKNTAHDSIRIIPSDIGVDSYYWGVKLVAPTSGVYYKTLGNLNDNATIMFDLTFTNPGAAGYTDFPANWQTGTWNWYLFISSTSSTSWTTSAPSNIIMLPTDSGISRLITTGTFIMLPYCVYGYNPGTWTAIHALPKAGGSFVAAGGSANYDYGIVNTNSGTYYSVLKETPTFDWVHYRVYNAANDTVLCAVDATDSNAVDGTTLRVWCDANTGNIRGGYIYLNTSYEIYIEQLGPPPVVYVECDDATVTISGVDYTLTAGTNSLWVQFTVSGMTPTPPQTLYIKVLKYGPTTIGTDTITGQYNGTKTRTITLSENAQYGASYWVKVSTSNA